MAYASPFPPLQLSVSEKAALCRTVSELVGEVEATYEALQRNSGRFDSARWTLVRERDDVRVYHDRRPGAGTGNKDMHLLVASGSTPGNLHDVMYGMLNHSTEAMRVKTAYVGDTLVDGAVLESILAPTAERPFQSLTVKWFVKGVPRHVRVVSKQRDAVIVDACGIKRLASGDVVGYRLLHSVSFAQMPPLPAFDRFTMSFTTIWRQTAANHLQGFLHSFVEITDGLFVPLLVKSVADSLTSLGQYVHCSQMKKLAWLVTRQTPRECHQPVNACSVCGAQDRTSQRGVKSTCAVCGDTMCSKCRVKRALSVVAANRQLVQLKTRVCVRCVVAANALDAAIVARDEAGVGTQALPSNAELLAASATCPRSVSGSEAASSPTRTASFSSFLSSSPH